MLGVAPGTLRRWSDAGTVSAFTTPGGHRRYRRVTLERLLPTENAATRALRGRFGITPSRLARAYRQEARVAAHNLPWVMALNEEQREWFRQHGRRLAETLLTHLDAAGPDETRDSLTLAATEAADYGRMTADLHVSLGDAVESFLQFRRPFLHQVGLLAGRVALDATATSQLLDRAERAMDRLLLAAMSGHTVERVAEPYEPSPDTARLL